MDARVRDGGARDAPRADAEMGCGVGLMECPEGCVDTMNSADNCGGCGRTCASPGGTALCVAGACTTSGCSAGFLDCNGDAADGCERMDDCVAGGSCPTACGTTGALDCTDGCAPVCRGVESCNLADDDCNGVCDDGAAGCRVGVHRSRGNGGHFYTTNLAEAGSAGYTVEFANYFYLYAAAAPGLTALYRCLKGNGLRFYTVSPACEGGGTSEGILGFAATAPTCGSTPLHRLYGSGDHFYTTSADERDRAVAMFGYGYEAVVGHVWRSP